MAVSSGPEPLESSNFSLLLDERVALLVEGLVLVRVPPPELLVGFPGCPKVEGQVASRNREISD